MRARDRQSARKSQPQSRTPPTRGGTARARGGAGREGRKARGDHHARPVLKIAATIVTQKGERNAHSWARYTSEQFWCNGSREFLSARLYQAVGPTLAIIKVTTSMKSVIYDYKCTLNATRWCSRQEMGSIAFVLMSSQFWINKVHLFYPILIQTRSPGASFSNLLIHHRWIMRDTETDGTVYMGHLIQIPIQSTK